MLIFCKLQKRENNYIIGYQNDFKIIILNLFSIFFLSLVYLLLTFLLINIGLI